MRWGLGFGRGFYGVLDGRSSSGGLGMGSEKASARHALSPRLTGPPSHCTLTVAYADSRSLGLYHGTTSTSPRSFPTRMMCTHAGTQHLNPTDPSSSREARERAELAEVRADEAARRQGAPVEELERQTRMCQRLRADLARKEQALKVRPEREVERAEGRRQRCSKG